ncbi:hypothetical protein [Bacillus sp. AFS001701]|uniref:hypothetical protein n=1 Tax=Bacillus sp. AFS001701 TaxID=2033480 RepID=UPI001597186A|nr:hypothetical protein [Bacillus sp. AFS001701]
MRQSKLLPQNVIEIGSLEGIRMAVLNNIGVGLGSSVYIKKEISSGDLVPNPKNLE